MIENWLTNLWNFLDSAAYWLAAIVGTGAIMLYIVTRERRFKTTVFVAVLSYLFIKVVGSAI